MKEVGSQTLPSDRTHLHRLGNCFKTYRYLEVGVFHGGTLVLQIRNPRCTSTMGVDTYPEVCFDERHFDISYGMSFERLRKKLTDAGYDLTNFESYSGDLSTLPVTTKYDFAFIDAEHTNKAAFRDAVNCMSHLKENSILLFHDTTLIYGAIDSFCSYLELQKVDHEVYKLSGSELTAIIFGDLPTVKNYCSENMSSYDDFKIGAKIRLGNNVKNMVPNWEKYIGY